MSDRSLVNRRRFMGTVAAAMSGGSAALALNEDAFLDAKRPNVILIMTDDQGYGDIGCHGNDKINTPNLDRLAKESVHLSQFYVCPVCAPTRACLMTGRYNYRTGAIDTYIGRAMMHTQEVTLAELLGAAGYRTGIFGKWHLGDNYPLRPIENGFQEALVHNGGGIGQPSDPPGNRYFNPILQHNGIEQKFRGYCTDIFTDAAIEFIETNQNRPFFCYLATNAPHTPLQIEDHYVEPYRAMGLDETTARVYGMVTNIDDNIGRLLEKLKTLNLTRNTIVIFLTDNGPQQERYNAGMRGRKGSVYEGGIRVPCFIRWPGQFQAEKTIDRIAGHIDITPTLLEACGVGKPTNIAFDGVNLMPLLQNKKEDWPERTLYFQWHRGDEPEPFRACAAREQRYKLVDGKELYNMENDPGEQKDIAADHPDIVARLRTGYENWFRDVSSTRGYAPPRIFLGTRYENPTILTRQDWRGPRAGWGDQSLGYWEIEVIEETNYSIRLRFKPVKESGEAYFQLGDILLRQNLEKGADTCWFKSIRLPKGPGRLEAGISTAGETVGVHYVDVHKIQ